MGFQKQPESPSLARLENRFRLGAKRRIIQIAEHMRMYRYLSRRIISELPVNQEQSTFDLMPSISSRNPTVRYQRIAGTNIGQTTAIGTFSERHQFGAVVLPQPARGKPGPCRERQGHHDEKR